MAWLEQLDAHARRWPWPVRGLYGVIKWTLAALGAYLIGLYLLDKFSLL